MISRWKLLNFKSVKKSVDLPFTNLTLFAGANSSGKSTLIQSILIISQTLGSKISSRSVVLNGQLAKLGQFDDLRSVPRRSDSIMIGWECIPSYPDGSQSSVFGSKFQSKLTKIGCEVRFGIDDKEKNLSQLHPVLFDCRIFAMHGSSESHIRLRRKDKRQSSKPDQSVAPESLQTAFSKIRSPRKDYEVSLDETTMVKIRQQLGSVDIVGCSLQHFLPTGIWFGFDEVNHVIAALAANPSEYHDSFLSPHIAMSPDVVKILRELAIQEKVPLDLSKLDPGNPGSLASWHKQVESLNRSDSENLRGVLQSNMDSLRQAISAGKTSSYSVREDLIRIEPLVASEFFDLFFSAGVHYLGPLRDEPKALYPVVTSVSPYDVGLKGEHTAAILELHRHSEVSYINSACFSNPEIDLVQSRTPLLKAVIDWLQYMDVAEGVLTEDKGKLGYELKIFQSSDEPYDLTHVGVGVSQVLPIIVMCLLAPRDATLIFEQPELHLHPKVQTLLGDFFLSIAMQGKQCIIETHSEYLINRLRYRAACAKADSISELLKIYFVEQRDGTSAYREVQVNKYGAIQDWPEGFFDQSQRETESILTAAALKYESETND